MLKSYRTKQGCDTGDCVRVDCDRGRGAESLTFPLGEAKIARRCEKQFGPGRLRATGLRRYDWVPNR